MRPLAPGPGRTALLALATLAQAALPGPALASCPASPLPLCREFGRTTLAVDADRARVQWRATGGPATAIGEFGVPTAASGLSLCAWDDAGPLLALDVAPASTCGDSPCWTKKGTSGWRYADRDATVGPLRRLDLKGSAKAKTRLRASIEGGPSAALPVSGSLVFQLVRDNGPVCFESTVRNGDFVSNDATSASAKVERDAAAPVATSASAGCGGTGTAWVPGTSTVETIEQDSVLRPFRVWLPPTYDDDEPVPVVFLLHGAFGSGAQVEGSSRMLEAAAASGFAVVSPDGRAGPFYPQARTWNAGACCGFAENEDVDDVGFVAAMLDRLEQEACVDRRRVFATGMSNGSMMSHRLGCELADRIRAIAAVAGTDITDACRPARPVPVLSIHGTADASVPFEGGWGCGPAGVPFRSVAETLGRWRGHDGCSDAVTASRTDGDAACTAFGRCAPGGHVESCAIPDGGHQWPGGEAPTWPGSEDCPFGYQSPLFPASARILAFFEATAPR